MKTDGVIFWVLVWLLSLVLSNQGWSQVLETTEHHLKQAESYQELAEWQSEDIAAYKKGNIWASINVPFVIKKYEGI